jgi:hypothetical protein
MNLRIVSCLLPLLGTVLPAAAQVERGVFHIIADGREIGTERFEIAPTENGVRATAELQITQKEVGHVVETATLTLAAGVEPTRYERVQKSPKRGSVTATFADEKASVHYVMTDGQTHDVEFKVPRNVVILDTNFFHHYTFLVRHYDFLKGGQQHMTVLVPQEGLPGVVTVEYVGPDQALRKLVAHTDELDIQLWTDDAGRIVRLAVPAANVEITRAAK